MCRISAGLVGPSLSSHAVRRRSNAVARRRAASGGRSRSVLRGCETGNRRTRDAVDRLLAGRQLVLPGDVVARARRQHLDVGVAREPLGDVSRVQFGAAADVRAVALNDDRQLHWSAGIRPNRPAPSGRRRRRPDRRRNRRRRPAARGRRGARDRPAPPEPRRPPAIGARLARATAPAAASAAALAARRLTRRRPAAIRLARPATIRRLTDRIAPVDVAAGRLAPRRTAARGRGLPVAGWRCGCCGCGWRLAPAACGTARRSRASARAARRSRAGSTATRRASSGCAPRCRAASPRRRGCG